METLFTLSRYTWLTEETEDGPGPHVLVCDYRQFGVQSGRVGVPELGPAKLCLLQLYAQRWLFNQQPGCYPCDLATFQGVATT